MKFQYIAEKSSSYTVKISTPSDIIPVLKRYRRLKQEAFLCITLDGAHQVIRVRMVSVGIVNRAIVHPREVFVGAIEDRAVAIILCHNHPSGNTDPSREDIDITKRLKDAGEILGIGVLDHVILGRDQAFYSFLENNCI